MRDVLMWCPKLRMQLSLSPSESNRNNNFLTRDPEFAAGFLKRHQDKLIFGSDCPCLDGHGGGAANNRCVARATLTALKTLASPAVFRKITWENGTRILGVA